MSIENKQPTSGGDSVTNLIEGLSRRAEAALSQRAGPSPEAFAALSPEATQQLVHDLQVHQIELEMQNEELRRTHAALESSRSHYFDFYDLAPVGYCTVTEKGLIREVNLTTCALLNVTRSQLIKQPISKFIFNDDQGIYYGLRNRLRDSGGSLSCELRLLQRNDTPFWAHLVVRVVQDDDGVSELRIVLSEITERKRLEQELRDANAELTRQSESRYRTLIKWTPEPLVVHDGKKIIFANPAAIKMLGAASDKELVGKGILELVHPDSRDIVRERLRAAVEQGLRIPLVEEKCLKLDGTPIDVEVRSRPIDFGGKSATLISVRDITERKLAEKFSLEQSDRLRLLYEASQRLSSTLDLNEIYRIIDDFMSAIAPDCDFLVSAFDPDTQLITCRAFVMNGQALDVSAFPPIPLEEEGRGTQSLVIRSGKPLLLNDYQATIKTARTSYFVNDQTHELDEQVDPEEEVPQSALIVPLKVGEQVTGVVQVMSYRPNAFSEEQLQLLESLALHIASAKQNAQLYARVQSELNERKALAATLSESEERYRAAFRASPDAVNINRVADGLYIDINEGFTRLTGWTREDVLGKSSLEIGIWRDQADRQRLVEALQRDGLCETLEADFVTKSGNIKAAQMSARIMMLDGAPCILSITRDITQRKQAEQTLRESESFKSSILDSLDAEFAIVDRNGLILDVNRRWQQFSLDNSQEPGKPAPHTDVGANYLAVCAVAGTDGGWEAGAGIQSVLEGRLSRFRLEYRCNAPQRQRWFLMTVMPLGEDAKDGAVIMHTDISERKQAQAVDAFLAQAGSSPDAEPFFDALARFLAQSLQMDYICIDRLEGDKLNATTLAVWHNGQFEDNLTYALRDTPCGDVVGQKVCCFPASVRQFFPNDAALQELHAESYIGVTLWSHTGQPIGLIAVIGRSELSNRDFAESTLARVVVRASGELERLNAEAATYRSETRFRGVFEKSYAGIAVADATGTLLEVNDNLARMLEYERQELIGMNIAQFTHADDLAVELVYLNEMRAGERDEYRMNKRYLTRTGVLIWVDLLVTVVRNLEGNAVNVIGLVVDIRERMKAEAKLQLAASVFSHAREGIVITDASGLIIDINEAFTRITGYGREEVLGHSPSILKSDRQDPAFYEAMWRDLTEHGHWSGEIWNRRHDGETYAELLAISSVRDAAGVVQQYVGLFSDITAIKQHQSQLEHVAHFDALTSLPNRVLLADRLQQAMAQAQRREHHLAVVYLDLDGFKAINDRHGHDAGDQVLITLAQRMKQALREGDSLARIGGDEFVAVLIDLEDQPSSRTMLTRLLAACAQNVQVGEQSLQLSASLGVTFYPQEQEIDADQLLRQADQAMYQAKLAGKNRYHMFDATLDSSIRGRHESVERIRLALEMHEFVMHYQPKVNMRSGQIVGAEALIRWQHPEKGLLSPGVFLPVIEDHVLAVSVGEWVIDTALTQIELWHTAGLDMKVSVNIGARQLQQSDFVDRLKFILAKHPQVMPTSLELEVLETSALEDIAQVSQVIEACAQIGVKFALDDFGTGYSSLTYLKRLRVALLKIDQSFVRDMLEDPDDLAILQGIIGLAAAFKRDVIAEGVETVEHGSLLLQLGCELAQGYGIARPMPAAQMPQWAAQWQPDAAWDSVWSSTKVGKSLNGIEGTNEVA